MVVGTKKKMDDLDLPDIDPAFPEPDFFDAQAAPPEPPLNDVVVGTNAFLPQTEASPNTSQTTMIPPVDSVLPAVDVPLPDLNDLEQFNDLILLPPTLSSSGFSSEETPLPNTKHELDEELKDAGVSEVKEKGDVKNGVDEEEESENDETTLNERKNEQSDSKSNSSSVSHSNTPDTNGAGSKATIHLLKLPTPKIGLKKGNSIIPKESPSKQSGTSSLSAASSRTSERLRRGTRTKRKLSDVEGSDTDYKLEEDEQEEEEDDNFDDLIILKDAPIPTRRSGRQRKKLRHDESGEDEEGSNTRTARGGRQLRGRTKAPARFGRDGSQGDDSDLEVPSDSESIVIFTETSPSSSRRRGDQGKPNYWMEDGIVCLKRSNGSIKRIKPCIVRVRRMTPEEIQDIIEDKPDSTTSLSPVQRKEVLLEVCIDNFMSAVAAVEGGAKRIELCSSLLEGGLTPTPGLLTHIKQKFKDIPVFVMIRPRGGDFLYGDEEVEIMARDITYFKELGADGFVFGALTEDCDVDEDTCQLLKEKANPLPCTFHRAFDKVADPLAALETVIKLGFDRILTSGLEATAKDGIATLKRLVKAAGDRICIMAGAGINEDNVAEIVQGTGVTEVHGSASQPVKSMMSDPRPSTKPSKRGKKGKKTTGVKMGAMDDDDIIKITNQDIVRTIVRNANNLGGGTKPNRGRGRPRR